MNSQLLAAIDARHRLTPQEEAVLDRARDFVRRVQDLPIDKWPVIEFEDLEFAVRAWEEAEDRG